MTHAIASWEPGEPPAAPPPDLLEAWGQLWMNRTEPYALQQEDGTYRWVYAPYDAPVLAAHLAGAATVALSSLSASGTCRWLCLNADQADALPELVALAAALARVGLPGLVEASRRGGHLWLLLDAPAPTAAARRVVLRALEAVRAAGGGLQLPTVELYPDTTALGVLGHAVRLPLGIHRLTGRRYALFDAQGHPCAFTTTDAAVRFVRAWPRVSATDLVRRDEGLRQRDPRAESDIQLPERPRARVGTHSPVIRWVDAQISPLDLLADLAPETELRKVGRGYLGWCPFHDDQAADAAGRPGTPSFYVMRDRRFGWSWRCLIPKLVGKLYKGEAKP